MLNERLSAGLKLSCRRWFIPSVMSYRSVYCVQWCVHKESSFPQDRENTVLNALAVIISLARFNAVKFPALPSAHLILTHQKITLHHPNPQALNLTPFKHMPQENQPFVEVLRERKLCKSRSVRFDRCLEDWDLQSSSYACRWLQ